MTKRSKKIRVKSVTLDDTTVKLFNSSLENKDHKGKRLVRYRKKAMKIISRRLNGTR